MCVRSQFQFSKCDHVTTTLTHCPTHHREQQEQSRGLFGCLFRRPEKVVKKNCGRIVPHYLYNEGYCQDCSVQKQQLKAQSVGHGALKVRKHGPDDVLRDEQKEAARKALHKSGKTRQKPKGGGGGSNHEVLHVETSVWLSDLYHHPETLAKKDVYAREAAPAPPISSAPRREGHARRSNTRPSGGPREHRRGESRKVESSASPQWMPSYGSSQPLMKPAPPAPALKYSGRFAQGSAGLPPAVGLPPLPPQIERARAKATTQSKAEPSRRPKEEGAKKKQAHHHHHRTNDRTQQQMMAGANTQAHNSMSRMERSGVKKYAFDPRHDDKTTFSIYMDIPADGASYDEPPPSPPREYKPYWVEEPSRWDTKKAALAGWIDKKGALLAADDKDSDVSFVCKTAKAMSDQDPRRRRRGGSRK